MTEKYTLIISEKPQSAKRIAQSLADDKVEDNKTADGVPFYAITRDGRSIIVAPAVGHLFGLKQSSKGWNYPVFDIHWEPIYFKKASAYTKKYFDNLQALAKNAEDFIIATDYDIEGDVIGINILKFICNKESAKRMKFSTLIKSDLEEAYASMMPSMDFGQVNAGLARHTLDWYYGINITRALSLAMKSAGRFFILSTGRVQGPSLKILADREAEIRAFQPTPFWEMEMRLNIAGVEIIAMHEKEKFWVKSDAEKILEECKGKKTRLTGIEKKKYKQKPPTPFDLTTLQSESYRWFGFTPMQTQNIAQSLYEAGLISYPRTSSQKLPEKIGYHAILKSLGKQKGYKSLADELLLKTELKPNEGEKSDPAHPSIYPTGERPERLTAQNQKVYDLIVKRFLAVFAEHATRESLKYVFAIGANNFFAVGKTTLEEGWLKFYAPYISAEDQTFPELEENKEYQCEVLMIDKETQPPNRFNEASIVKELEKRGLGTKATRATIVRTLFLRGYVLGRAIEVSDLGSSVANTLDKYSPEILSEELTRSFEEKMDKIQTNEINKEDVIAEAEVLLKKVMAKFKENEKAVGEELLKAFIETRRNAKLVGKCHVCAANGRDGDLKIIRSMKSGKRFIGCSKYPDCKTGFPLPQTGVVEPMKQACSRCGKPMVVVRREGRVFRNCIDHECKPKKKFIPAGAAAPAIEATSDATASSAATQLSKEADATTAEVKPKKTRKKSAKAVVEVEKEAEVNEAPAEGKPKRKRGRPRKTETA